MDIASDYETVPYPDFVHPRTNPDRIAATARLFGLRTADPSKCRVLEIGCGQGGNLISLASIYPESEFVGIDLSPGHIKRGLRNATAAGIPNVELHAMNVADFDADRFGTFDYIIAHGIYSWVPDPIARHVLRICRQTLSPAGLAFVSYNTYPGWHAKSMIRDMIRYHTASIPEPDRRIAAAKRFLEDLVVSIPETTAYGQTLREEFVKINQSDEAYLFHEQFEAINRPLMFVDFIDEIAREGLRYVSEANLTYLPTHRMPTEMARSLAAMPLIRREQHIDFFADRSFRQSLLAHSDTVGLNDEPDVDAIVDLWLSTSAKTGSAINLDELQLIGPETAKATVRSSSSRIAMTHLIELKGIAIRFSDLWEFVLSQTRDMVLKPDSKTSLGSELLQLAKVGLVDWHVGPSPYTLTSGDHPTVSAWSRYQASVGETVATRRHQAIRLDEATRQLVQHCDGKHDLNAITDAVFEFIQRDAMHVHSEGQPISDSDQLRELVHQEVLRNLSSLAERGLFASNNHGAS